MAKQLVRYPDTMLTHPRPRSVKTTRPGIWRGTLRALCSTAYIEKLVVLPRPVHEVRVHECYRADSRPGLVEFHPETDSAPGTFTVRRDLFVAWLKSRAGDIIATEGEAAAAMLALVGQFQHD
ncbi:MAG: hypothetical protein PHI63_06215 [Patescibacteria group bacterium]|nr:hypothetical protein [Patescibacteria group bacterium]